MKLKFIIAMILFFGPMVALADEACDAGLAAFSETVYPLLRSSCVNCHSGSGKPVGHSSSDVEEAYRESLFLTRFKQIKRSSFMRKVRGKHWLDEDEYKEGDGTTPDKMEEVLTDWWEGGQNTCVDNFDAISQAIEVPAKLPNRESGEYISLKWDMGKVSPDYAGLKFLVDIQRFSKRTDQLSGSYRLKNLRLVSLKAIALSDIRFALSSETAAYENIYQKVSTSLGPSSNEQMLSAEHMIVIQRQDADVIEIKVRNMSMK